MAGSVVVVTLCGCILELLFFRHLRSHSVLHLIVITIGLSIVIQECALHIWDEKVRALPYFTGMMFRRSNGWERQSRRRSCGCSRRGRGP